MKHEIHADCLGSSPAVEVFSIEQQKHHLVTAGMVDVTRNALELAAKWLPAAAEEYHISANIKDYVLVPVVIMPSELPNRNQIGFPYKELTKFNVEAGNVAYRTWKRRGCYVEHFNKQPEKASGVIFDTAFRPMARTNNKVWKVINLCGFDRSKAPKISNSILAGDSAFSMGCLCAEYRCSVCGHAYEPPVIREKEVIKAAVECEHLTLGKPRFKIFDGKLAYYQAIDVTGLETSFVKIPAYNSAKVAKGTAMSLFD